MSCEIRYIYRSIALYTLSIVLLLSGWGKLISCIDMLALLCSKDRARGVVDKMLEQKEKQRRRRNGSFGVGLSKQESRMRTPLGHEKSYQLQITAPNQTPSNAKLYPFIVFYFDPLRISRGTSTHLQWTLRACECGMLAEKCRKKGIDGKHWVTRLEE